MTEDEAHSGPGPGSDDVTTAAELVAPDAERRARAGLCREFTGLRKECELEGTLPAFMELARGAERGEDVVDRLVQLGFDPTALEQTPSSRAYVPLPGLRGRGGGSDVPRYRCPLADPCPRVAPGVLTSVPDCHLAGRPMLPAGYFDQ